MNKINNKQNNFTNNKSLLNKKNLANNKVNSNKSLKNNSKKSLNIKFDKKIIKYTTLVISFILLLLLIYLVVFLIKYLTTGCYQKHSFFDYIKKRSFNNVCIHK